MGMNVAVALGECVHVAGISNYLRLALGTDQDAQENFFHPERQNPRRFGAGGVPVRSVDDFEALYAATRCGNYPLLRTYSGSDDFIRLACIIHRTDYWRRGRTPERIGIGDWSVSELTQYVMEGVHE